MNNCACGCGELTRTNFLHGHNMRGKKRSVESISKQKEAMLDEVKRKQWCDNLKKSANRLEFKEALRKANLGKTLSKEHREKIGAGNSGKIRTEETKVKISDKLKGTNLGGANPMYGKSGLKGDKNPNWKGGTSRIYKTGYYSTEYKDWRKSVFERDNYICQKCGFKKDCKNYVTAHHIKSFAKYPELRYDINNGITLCEDCHCEEDNYRARFKKKQIK